MIVTGILASKFAYKGPVYDLSSRIESLLSIDLEIEEILYYLGTESGPFGEGDEYLIIKISEISEQQFYDKMINNMYSFPVDNNFKEYIERETFIKSASRQFSFLEYGYYGIYSKVDDRFLSIDEINSINKISETEVLNRYIVFQLDPSNHNLYIRVYS